MLLFIGRKPARVGDTRNVNIPNSRKDSHLSVFTRIRDVLCLPYCILHTLIYNQIRVKTGRISLRRRNELSRSRRYIVSMKLETHRRSVLTTKRFKMSLRIAKIKQKSRFVSLRSNFAKLSSKVATCRSSKNSYRSNREASLKCSYAIFWFSYASFY